MNIRKLNIATAKSRFSKDWNNTQCEWSDLVKTLGSTKRTNETVAEYKLLDKSEKDKIKDVGGFVGGELKEGKRRKGYVNYRDIVTLDMDNIPSGYDPEFELDLSLSFDYVVYSTHKHTTDKPRLRIIIPLNRSVKGDEYEAISRKLASKLGMDYFDDSTYEAERLMYWPSTSSDGEFLYIKSQYDEWCDADKILNEYSNWTDIATWPYSSRVNSESVRKAEQKAENPLEKSGIVGVFCRHYPISLAISEFLSEVYEPTDNPTRYHFIGADSMAGAIVYDDIYMYSRHSNSDRAANHLCNAFDLVRIHKFGDLDKDIKEHTPITSYPSYKAMVDFVLSLDGLKGEFINSMIKNDSDLNFEPVSNALAIMNDDTKVIIQNESWTELLSLNRAKEIESSIDNINIIMANDPKFTFLGRKNLFRDRFEVNKAPWTRVDYPFWTDADDSSLRHYLEYTYHIEGKSKIDDAFNIYCQTHNYHPIKEYLESLKWDGKKRIETLLIDYLGADDTSYVRQVTTNVLVAAVKRIYEPGCKFDQMLVLVGNQGNGKSTLCQKLGMQWFSDTMPKNLDGKDAYDALEGVWIMEQGELASLKKADRDTLKSFISKRVDSYRKAYAKNMTDNPRTCIFIGTTNESDFLNDPTGSRRFWPVDCHSTYQGKKADGDFMTPWDLEQADVDNLWAEAFFLYNNTDIGNHIMELGYDADKEWHEQIDSHEYVSDNLGVILKYLDLPIPKDWSKKDVTDRYSYVQEHMLKMDDDVEGEARQTISVIEIRKELGDLLSGNNSSNAYALSREIGDILSNMKGWKKTSTVRTIYGTQKGWRRM